MSGREVQIQSCEGHKERSVGHSWVIISGTRDSQSSCLTSLALEAGVQVGKQPLPFPIEDYGLPGGMRASLVAQWVKNLPAMQETPV